MPRAVWVRTLLLALGLGLAASGPVPAAPPEDPRPAARRLYHKSRNFKIPIQVDGSEKTRLREIQLWWSADQGDSWDIYSRVGPESTFFSFKAPRDGEFWFAVRTQDTRGYLYPAASQGVEPGLKVVVDTVPPTLALKLKSRRSGQVRLQYEAADKNLDLSKLHIEYQAEGASTWRSVPLARTAEFGDIGWNANTAAMLKVRGSVVDRAGNVTLTELEIAQGVPDADEFAGDDPQNAPSPPPLVNPITRNTGRVSPGRARAADPGPPPDLEEAAPAEGGAEEGPAGGGAAADIDAGNTNPDIPRLLVASPRFPLKYSVENAGAAGAASVEIYMTRDDGRTWGYLGRDPDNVSPFYVELPGDGVYGLRLVARSASGFGDRKPQPGDLPETYAEVDSTPPAIQMGTPKLVQSGGTPTLQITWKAEDPHLGPKPVVLSFRPDTPDGIWQQFATVANTGQYLWKLPTGLPGRIHLKVDVIDTLGNRGYAETPEDAAFVVDRSRPKGRIIGLDPGANPRVGSGGGGPRY